MYSDKCLSCEGAKWLNNRREGDQSLKNIQIIHIGCLVYFAAHFHFELSFPNVLDMVLSDTQEFSADLVQI